MTLTRKFLCIGALILAGSVALLVFFLGLMALAWSGFGRGKNSVSILCFFLPFLLALPLFVLSLGGTRLGSVGLWVLVPYHWFSLICGSFPNPAHSVLGFLKLLAICASERQLLLLVLLAALVQFGVNVIPIFCIDKYFCERMRRNDDSHA